MKTFAKIRIILCQYAETGTIDESQQMINLLIPTALCARVGQKVQKRAAYIRRTARQRLIPYQTVRKTQYIIHFAVSKKTVRNQTPEGEVSETLASQVHGVLSSGRLPTV